MRIKPISVLIGTVAVAWTSVAFASTAAQPKPRAVAYQPDAILRVGSSSVGNNVYGVAVYGSTTQMKTVRVKRGDTAKATLTGQNDAAVDDSLEFESCQSATHLVISYTNGGNNVTADMTGGTFTTATLQPGKSVNVQLKVKAKKAAVKGENLSCEFFVTSVGDSGMIDETIAKIKVSG